MELSLLVTHLRSTIQCQFSDPLLPVCGLHICDFHSHILYNLRLSELKGLSGNFLFFFIFHATFLLPGPRSSPLTGTWSQQIGNGWECPPSQSLPESGQCCGQCLAKQAYTLRCNEAEISGNQRQGSAKGRKACYIKLFPENPIRKYEQGTAILKQDQWY